MNLIPIWEECCCKRCPETSFGATSSQFVAVETLILRSPSWTRSWIQKYRVSECFVRCPGPKRSLNEPAVELPLRTPTFHVDTKVQSGFLSKKVTQHRPSRLCRTRPLPRSLMSNSEAWSRISPSDLQAEPRVPWCSSPKAVSKSLFTNAVFSCRTPSVGSPSPLEFAHQMLSKPFLRNEVKFTRQALALALPARSNLSWANYDSLVQADRKSVVATIFSRRTFRP